MQKHSEVMPTPSAAASSPLARAALTAYVFLIIYASWYPFSSWRDLGLSPWEYIHTQPPRYWTAFDVITNIIGYVPLGILLVFALYPKMRGIIAVFLAIVGGAIFVGLHGSRTNLFTEPCPLKPGFRSQFRRRCHGCHHGCFFHTHLPRPRPLAFITCPLVRTRCQSWFSGPRSMAISANLPTRLSIWI